MCAMVQMARSPRAQTNDSLPPHQIIILSLRAGVFEAHARAVAKDGGDLQVREQAARVPFCISNLNRLFARSYRGSGQKHCRRTKKMSGSRSTSFRRRGRHRCAVRRRRRGGGHCCAVRRRRRWTNRFELIQLVIISVLALCAPADAFQHQAKETAAPRMAWTMLGAGLSPSSPPGTVPASLLPVSWRSACSRCSARYRSVRSLCASIRARPSGVSRRAVTTRSRQT